MQDNVKALLGKRKDRAIATVLGYKDEYVDEYLPDDTARELRKEILDQFNDFYDFCLDLMSTVEAPSVIVNDFFIEKLDERLDAVFQAGVDSQEEE